MLQDPLDNEDRSAGEGPVPDAPTPRARALREEIFGAALNLDEAAYVLGLDRTTVAKYLRDKIILGFQIGREWLVPEDELREYVRRSIQGRRADAGSGLAIDERQSGQEPGLFDRMRRDLPLGRKRHGKHEQSQPVSELNRCTTRSRKALVLAREESVRLGHHFCGTEHLLLGLLREGHGIAAQVLSTLGVELEATRSAVGRVVARSEGPAPTEPTLTPRARKVLELASDEARRLGHAFIGTEHLLLGLIREGEGVAAGVLEELGVDLGQARAHILRMINPHARGAAGAGGTEAAHQVPADAAALLAPDEPGLPCPACDARSPRYFRYCFNCGAPLGGN